jgi:hypothetical protein
MSTQTHKSPPEIRQAFVVALPGYDKMQPELIIELTPT